MTADAPANSDLPVTFGPDGLIPAIVQDVETRAVVMVAYMNADALRLTRETRRTHFWSRSRKTLWRKGETSGHEQIVRDILVNCYADSLLILVDQIGPGCHTDHATCYFRRLTVDGIPTVTLRQTDLDLWYGAYEHLRDHDLSAESNTSRLFHDPNPHLEHRLADELVELTGVLRGTHRHADLASDVVLEASQSLYWLALIAARQHLLASGWLAPLTQTRPPVALDDAVETLLLGAEYWGEVAPDQIPDDPAALASGTAFSIADAVRAAFIDLQSVLDYDLTSLRSKPYLSEYFSSR